MRFPNTAIWGYYGYANTGDEAILSSMLRQFRRKQWDKNITVFSGNPGDTHQSHSVKAVHSILSNRFTDHLIRLLGRGRENYKICLKSFKKAELIIVGGGGLFFDHPDYNIYLLNLLNSIDKALKKKKKVVLIGVGVGPIYHESSRQKIREVFNRVELITVRESFSYDLLAEIGISGDKVHITADLAYLLEPALPKEISDTLNDYKLEKDNKPVIAISLCGRHVDRPGYVKALVACCEHMIQKYNATIWFIPMQTLTDIDDRPGMRQIAAQISKQENVGFLDGVHTPEVILGLLKHADLVIGERFHTSIFSIINRCPLLGISYLPKVARLFTELNHPDLCFDLNKLDSMTLISTIDKLWGKRQEITGDLDTFFLKMKVKAERNFELLEKVLNG